jgi:hypothetical protein
MANDLENAAPEKPTRRTNPETKIVQAIQRWAKKEGLFCLKFSSASAILPNGFRIGQRPGIPDLILIKDGRHVWIEVKTETGKLSDTQKKFLAELSAAGAETHVARSLEEVQKIMNGEEEQDYE